MAAVDPKKSCSETTSSGRIWMFQQIIQYFQAISLNNIYVDFSIQVVTTCKMRWHNATSEPEVSLLRLCEYFSTAVL